MQQSTYDVRASEFLLSDFEHVGELIPHDNISLDKDSTGLRGVFVDELLCFRTQSKIGNDDVAVLFK